MTDQPQPRHPGTGRAVLVYNLYRLGLLVVVTGVIYAAGMRNILVALVFGLLVSGVASYFLLYRQRAEIAAAVTRSVGRQRERYRDRVRAEDAAADALLSPGGQPEALLGPGGQPPAADPSR